VVLCVRCVLKKGHEGRNDFFQLMSKPHLASPQGEEPLTKPCLE
jgi:hypothetical protein